MASTSFFVIVVAKYLHVIQLNGNQINALHMFCPSVVAKYLHGIPLNEIKSNMNQIQGFPKKIGPIILFHMCFGIRVLSLFHLNTLNIPIQNMKCPKNTKNVCADIIFSPAIICEA